MDENQLGFSLAKAHLDSSYRALVPHLDIIGFYLVRVKTCQCEHLLLSFNKFLLSYSLLISHIYLFLNSNLFN